MGRKKSSTAERAFTGMEPAMREAIKNNRKTEIHKTRIVVEAIVKKLMQAMKSQSSTFAQLYVRTFGGGSSYEGLKVGKADEFDIDILLSLPEVVKFELKEDTIPGFVQLQLKNFEILSNTEPNLYKDLKNFVDDKGYLLTSDAKSTLMQSTFDKAINNFPNSIVKVGSKQFKILRVQNAGPAITLTVQGPGFNGGIDLVPCILLTKEFWPKGGFRSNPYLTPSDIFIVAKQPKKPHPHIDRYWRLSFQMQERTIIFNRLYMKPTIRLFKLIRDHFKHNVSSYAIKTIFIWELFKDNPDLDDCTPDLWRRKPISYCLIYMLERYLKYLENYKIPYFWNQKLNLLDNLTGQQIAHYKGDVAKMVTDIKLNPNSHTLLKYLS